MAARATLAALVATVVAGAAPLHAQTPDSVAVRSDSSLVVAPVAATPAGGLPAPALPRPSVALPEPEPGRVATPVPAVTSALSVEARLGLVPGVFDYTLGGPGRSGGLSVDGLDPARAALLLDGRPFDDLITGAPRYDLLPLAALGPLRVSDGRLGSPVSVEASARTFRLGRPVTELRYLAGQSGAQHVSATHAQTRLPPALLRGGSRDARLTLAGHVMSRNGRGTLAGATLRHTDVLARALLTRPSAAVDAGLLYTDRTDGARRGVVPGTAADIFRLSATVLDAAATRRSLRAEAWATVRARLLLTQPGTVTFSSVSQRLVYRSDAADTLRVHAQRAAVRLSQPLGGTFLARLDAVADSYPAGTSGPVESPGARLRLHASLRDSVTLGGAQTTVEGGIQLNGSRLFPSAAVRIGRGPSALGVRLGGAIPGRVEASGLAGIVAASTSDAERSLIADAATAVATRSWQLGLRAFGTVRWNAAVLVARDTLFAYETASEALTSAGATAVLGFRETAGRGVYARLAATAHTAFRADASDVARREADALPRLRADVRVGTRAAGIGAGVLDLDVALVGRAWTAFRGRVVEPRTGLLALPDPATALGAVLPARGTLGAEATATFSRRATVFLQIDHALGEIVGAAVVQGEPLPIRVVRFGVFWALLD